MRAMSETFLRFLTLKEVTHKTGLSAPSIRRLVKASDFPGPFDLSPKRIAFWEHEVEAWMQERAARGRKPKEMPKGGRKAGIMTEVPEDFAEKLAGVIKQASDDARRQE